MPLHKLDTPTYALVLTSTGQSIKYRPFLVKEQKILMMAQESQKESEMFQAMSDIVKSCTVGEVDTDNSPLFDIEYVFLKLRSKSVGEKTTVRVLCPDDNTTRAPYTLNTDEVEVLIDDKHSTVIELNDEFTLNMRYPSIKDTLDGLQGKKKTDVEKI